MFDTVQNMVLVEPRVECDFSLRAGALYANITF